jgi:hypothetical protein
MTSSTTPVLYLKPWTKQITTTRNMQQNLVNETDSETQSTSEDNFHQTFYNYEPSKLSMTLTVQPRDNFQKNIQIQSTQQTTQSIPNLLDVRKFSVLTQDEMSLRFTQQSTSFSFKAKAGQTSAELIFEFSCQLNNNFLPPSFQRKDSISFSLFQ